MNEYTNGSAVAEAAPDTQATAAPNKPNRHERRTRAKKAEAPVAAAQPAEPAMHSPEWFTIVIEANEQLAAQKLAEYNQIVGAVNILKQQRDVVAARKD